MTTDDLDRALGDSLGGVLRTLGDEQPDVPHLFDLVAARRLRERRAARRRTAVLLAAAAVVAVAVPGLWWAGAGPRTFTQTPATLTSPPATDRAGLEPRTADGWLALCGAPVGTPPVGATEPVLVVSCRDVVEPAVADGHVAPSGSGDGMWVQQVVERADGDTTDLLGLLTAPRADVPCLAVLYVGAETRTVVVVGPGGATALSWPRCSSPAQAEAVRKAGFVEVARRKVRQVESQADLDRQSSMFAAGCGEGSKFISMAEGTTRRAVGPFDPTTVWDPRSAMQVCLFDNGIDPGFSPGNTQPRFRSAVRLTGTSASDLATAMARAMTGPTASRACRPGPVNAFAYLFPANLRPGLSSRYAPVVVELEGCRRAYLWTSDGVRVWNTPDAVVQTLARLLGP